MNLYKESCERFTELLASSSAVPGGGGASALVGAIAIALGDMVGELTVGKKKYADVEEEIKELMMMPEPLNPYPKPTVCLRMNRAGMKFWKSVSKMRQQHH